MPPSPPQARTIHPRAQARGAAPTKPHNQPPRCAAIPLFLFDPRNTKRGAPISDPPFYTYGTLSGRFDDVSVLFLGEVWSRVAEETLLAGEVAL